MRRKLLEAGGTILDHHTFRRVTVCTSRRQQIASVAVELAPQHSSHSEVWHARLLLDGMGSTSPLALLRHAGAPFAGVCPTVGTVARGFALGSTRTSVDPTLGDILVSVADTQGNRQMIWEGFPGRDDELTVYLFYYAALTEAGVPAASPPSYSRLRRSRSMPLTTRCSNCLKPTSPYSPATNSLPPTLGTSSQSTATYPDGTASAVTMRPCSPECCRLAMLPPSKAHSPSAASARTSAT